MSGALQILLPGHPVPERPLYAISGPGQPAPRKITVFLEFLARWFRDHPVRAREGVGA